jgi:asparagine synthase (glutamine-hydrolysing)
VRRFCARQPQSSARPRLIERLYPYLARSPVQQRAMTTQFFLRGLDRANEPGFAHELRWHTSSALKRLFAPGFVPQRDARAEFLATLPPDFASWSPLARDQYIEIRTLLSGYLLSSQGDRMLMAHSVEGRFPFLDRDVIELASHLPHAHKLRVLDEKHVLKRVARPMLPASIVVRKKQPYRAPDALSFLAGADWIEDMISPAALSRAGVFDPHPVRQLWEKCKARASSGQFSNADNMAVVGVLSTQLLFERLVRAVPTVRTISPRTEIET